MKNKTNQNEILKIEISMKKNQFRNSLIFGFDVVMLTRFSKLELHFKITLNRMDRTM